MTRATTATARTRLDVEEDGDADDDDDDNVEMDTADPPARSPSSPRIDSIVFQESLPLAAAMRRAPVHRKSIGCRNPTKLSSSLSAPNRKPTVPIPVASRRKTSANPSVAARKSSDNAPT